MSLLTVAGANSASGGFEVSNSLKFEQDNSEQIHFTPSSSGNRRTWTFSCWVKRTELSLEHYMFNFGDEDYNQSGRTLMTFRTGVDQIWFGGGSAYQLKTTQVFRDTSAWYHIVLAVDTTQATDSNRLKLYINGEQVTDFDSTSYPSQNFEYAANRNHKHSIGYNHTDNASGFSGYMSEVALIDGQQLTPSSFGETDNDSGIWKPKDLSTLTFGSNGFYLKFDDSSSLGADSSSNNNDFTLVNISAVDQATDTPTNNFAILNTRHRVPDTTRKEGATTTVKNNNGWRTMVSTLGVSSGKWYFELSAGSEYTMIGVSGDGVYGSGGTWENYLGSLTGSLGYYGNSATYYQDGSDKSPTNVSSFVTDDIVGMALDVDNGKVYFHKNGTYQNQGNPNSGTNGYTLTGDAPYFLGLSTYQQSDQCEVNYGGYHVYSISSGNSDANGYGNFEYAVPSGYYALCTKNLAEYG